MLFVLFETALGYGLFEITEAEEIGLQLESVQVIFIVLLYSVSADVFLIWTGF